MARFAFLISTLATALLSIHSASADPRNGDPGKKDFHSSVELFDAISDGQVKVEVIAKDATRANLIFRNQTKQPLRLRIPNAFAGVPVLAQRGGGGGGFGGGGGGGQQSFGGGGGMMGGGGGGFFHVAPEAMRKATITTVCLEHGKKDPNPRVAYELQPIDSVTQDPRVHEVCKLLGYGKLDQQTAQAAAWHLTDGLTWEQLAQKIKIRHLNGTSEMFFSPQQVAVAARTVAIIARNVSSDEGVTESRHVAVSPGEQAEGPHEAVNGDED